MMFRSAFNQLIKLKSNQMVLYIFCGSLTTAVNVVMFYLLREVLETPLFLANFISISTAILFAFIVNKVIVFDSQNKNRRNTTKEFFLFLSMRLVSMTIEIIGVWFAVAILLLSDLSGKMMMQAVVITFNFFFSKYIVFRKGSVSNKPVQG